MINQLLAKAITKSLNQNPPKQVDLSAYYGNNNLLETALVDNAEISTLEGDLTSLSNNSQHITKTIDHITLNHIPQGNTRIPYA